MCVFWLQFQTFENLPFNLSSINSGIEFWASSCTSYEDWGEGLCCAADQVIEGHHWQHHCPRLVHLDHTTHGHPVLDHRFLPRRWLSWESGYSPSAHPPLLPSTLRSHLIKTLFALLALEVFSEDQCWLIITTPSIHPTQPTYSIKVNLSWIMIS